AHRGSPVHLSPLALACRNRRRDRESEHADGMEQRVSLITLGVADLAASRRFYEALGWSSSSSPDAGVVFFQAGSMVLGLWSREELAKDSGTKDDGGWG